ncbi:hypothetical protein AYJ57_21030 (plasmid) [Salipiger sp. CCB-MM3]|uniref:hypothetical protein n=1 Tax=Salipiger sp. CCB-MM3 TaxID=1792508 RepID=UPI00080AA190|nr:hypothetical protein [Salipiger sp. CCB-MM3]ANT62963.1 hypothetical protein AYJ57_21030 [Salipiger sp. CCB-MM3]
MLAFDEMICSLQTIAAVRPGHFKETTTLDYVISPQMIDGCVLSRFLQTHFDRTEEEIVRLVRFDGSSTLGEMYEILSQPLDENSENYRGENTKGRRRWEPPFFHEFVASIERLAKKERRTYRYNTRVSEVISPDAIASQQFMDFLTSSFRMTERDIDTTVVRMDRDTTLRQLYVQLRGAHLPWFANER